MKKLILFFLLMFSSFALAQINNINYYEYWLNSNYSGKYSVNIDNPNTLINVQSSVPISSLANGLNTFNIRFKDSLGQWSATQSSFFFKLATDEQVQIIYYEYWLDGDYSSKVSENISPTETFTINTSCSVQNLADGFHSFNIRYKDSEENWSSTQSYFFYKLAAPEDVKITYYEYWLDEQYENKVADEVNPVDTFLINSSVSILNLNNGFHSFNIHYKDSNGKWSSTQSYFFYKLAAPEDVKIAYYEYWLDEDYENKVAEEISPVDTFLINTSVSIQNLNNGFHKLNIRYKDSEGNWSVPQSYFFYKFGTNEPVKIVHYEYWLDDDYSNKISEEISPADTFSINTSTSILNLKDGFHRFSIRYKDSEENWSVPQCHFFYKLAPEVTNKIAQYRYWFDDNFENLYSIELTTTEEQFDITRHIILPVFAPNTQHSVHFQYKDKWNKWSAVVADTFVYNTGTITLSTPQQILPLNLATGVSINPTLRWNSSNAADYYILEIATNSDFSNVVQNLNITDTNYVLRNVLAINTQYFWRLRAKCNIYYSNWSSVRTFTTGEEQIISAPILSSPENSSIEQPLNTELIWESVENAIAYTVQVSLSSDFSELIVDAVDIPETSYQLSGLEYNTQYFWRVNATNGSQISLWSELWSFTTISSTTQDISLNSGWNLISSNINPTNPDLESIFDGMEELVIVKNAGGQTFNPNQGINQIGNWNFASAYIVYVNSPATLQIIGTAINPSEAEINLVAGWNLIAYLKDSPLSIETALASINSSIRLVKNNVGEMYYPFFGINAIGNMLPGQGYWIYMNENAVLVYPE